MSIRRTLAVVAASTLTLLSALNFASPASAASVGSIFASCTAYDGLATFSGVPGDTFTISFVGCDPSTLGTPETIVFDTATVTGPAGVTSPYTVNVDGPIVFTIASGATNGTYPSAILFTTLNKGVSVTVSGGAAADTTSTDSAPGPAPWFKAYQRHTKEETCNTGWNPSYAQWANNHSGGWVCVQELYYTGSTWATR